MKVDHDPKLRYVMEQIRQILDANDVGAVISLSSETHGEFALHFPPWADISVEDGRGLRVKMSSKNHARTESTAFFLFSQTDTLALHAKNFIDAANSVKAALKKQGATVEHTPFHAFVSFNPNRSKPQ
jgi:hypothetical protein